MTTDPYAGKVKFYGAVIDRLNQSIHAIAYKMAPVQSGSRVLDIGCGTGAQLARYVDAGCVVSGVDLSPSMLEAAKTRLGLEVDLQLADATQLPFADDTFDVVTASMFIHELDPRIRANVLAEVERVLGSDGRAVIVEFDSDPRKGFKAKTRRAVSTVFERIAGSDHHRNFKIFIDSSGVVGALTEVGLTVSETRTFPGGDLAIYILIKDHG